MVLLFLFYLLQTLRPGTYEIQFARVFFSFSLISTTLDGFLYLFYTHSHIYIVDQLLKENLKFPEPRLRKKITMTFKRFSKQIITSSGYYKI